MRRSAPDDNVGVPRPLKSALAVGWLAAASLIGWLEEVARSQAAQQHFGLPLSASADPRGAAAFAVPAAAAIITVLLLVAGVVLALGRRLLLAAAMAALGVALVMSPPHLGKPWLVVTAAMGIFGGVAAIYDETFLGPVNDRLGRRLDSVFSRWRVWFSANTSTYLRPIYRRLGSAAAGALAVVAAALVPLAIGDHVGNAQATTRTVFYVIADRICTPDRVVIDFGDSDTDRRVRVAERSTDGQSWRLLPGIYTVPVAEPVVLARIGRVKRSAIARLPVPTLATLPPICAGAS
jgi:hypothetical protein